MKILGIDPGKRGAWCVIEDGFINRCELINYRENQVIAKDIPFHEYENIIIEDRIKTVLAGQGTASTLSYTHNHGVLVGYALAKGPGNPPILINPKRWQSYYKFMSGATKSQSAMTCARLFGDKPSAYYLMDKGEPHDGKTDAALIAYYGYKKLSKL